MVSIKEKDEKIKIFNELKHKGKEIYYSNLSDTLYADLNDIFTDKNLGLEFLKAIGVERESYKIWNMDISKDEKIIKIARLLKGKSHIEYFEASQKAVENVDVPNESKYLLKNLKPTNLVIFSHTPHLTLCQYVFYRIEPLYNINGERKFIKAYGTILEEDEYGKLTGNIIFIPTLKYRKAIRDFEDLRLLKGK